jgi:zinc and cadmium transporter
MIYALLIASVLIGALIVRILNPKQSLVRLLLSFSGAYLLAITVLHMLPELYHHTAHKDVHKIEVGIFILLGVLIQSILESFSKGAEHGHIHSQSQTNKFPWLLFCSLSIHAISEGIPVGYSEGNELLWAIIVHKIPISIVLATFLLHSDISSKKSYFFIGAFALMSPLGVISSELFPFFRTYHSEITGITVGIFLHISTVILFESSKEHRFNFAKFSAILLGMLVAMLS